jgi:hypothetical protein
MKLELNRIYGVPYNIHACDNLTYHRLRARHILDKP